MNSVINGNEDPVDVQVFDIEKCFDALWTQECINDLFDAGMTNDKLPLLFLESRNAQCAVKINDERSEHVNIKNIIMQGTVWGSLFCTSTRACWRPSAWVWWMTYSACRDIHPKQQK